MQNFWKTEEKNQAVDSEKGCTPMNAGDSLLSALFQVID